jgi:hypothetical protein
VALQPGTIYVVGEQTAFNDQGVIIRACVLTDENRFACGSDIGGIASAEGDLIGVGVLADDPIVLRDEADAVNESAGTPLVQSGD